MSVAYITELSKVLKGCDNGLFFYLYLFLILVGMPVMVQH